MLQPLSPSEKLAIREHDMELVQYHLPRIIRMPVPRSVREAAWFRNAHIEDLIKVYAFPAYTLPTFSGKIFAALGLLLKFERLGLLKGNPMLIGSTSGNFGKDVAFAAMGFPVRGFRAVVNYGTPEGKLIHLRASGALIKIAPEGVLATDYAIMLAERDGELLLDQYTDEGSIEGHVYSMNHIAREMLRLDERAGFIFSAVTGTCSTLCGAKRYLPKHYPSPVKIMGVASMSKAEKVPGSRSLEDINDLKGIGGFFYRPEWANLLDFPLVTSVTQDEAYEHNAELINVGRVGSIGPTGALDDCGVWHSIQEHVENDTVEALMNDARQIRVVEFPMDAQVAYLSDKKYMSHFEAKAA
jgi:cysteine synthase